MEDNTQSGVIKPGSNSSLKISKKKLSPINLSNTTPPTKKKKTNQIETNLEQRAKDVADRLRTLSKATLMEAKSLQRMTDLSVGLVMEVTKTEEAHSIHGPCCIIHFNYVENGINKSTAVFAPKRFLDGSPTYPSIMVYLGLKAKSNGQGSYHDLRRVTEGTSTPSDMKRTLANLRAKRLEKLIQLFEIRHLKEFKAPSIFFYHNVGASEYKDAEGNVDVVPTVTFSTKVDGEEIQGTLTMPSRYALSLKENYPGIIIYKGLVTSHNTREYYDVVIMGYEEASRFYESSAQCKKDSAIVSISDDDE